MKTERSTNYKLEVGADNNVTGDREVYAQFCTDLGQGGKFVCNNGGGANETTENFSWSHTTDAFNVDMYFTPNVA